jgi:ACS family glucarate transporter-like MFS transporter
LASITGVATPRGKIRWLMVGLIFLVSAVSYLDRTNISIAAPALKLDLNISDVQLGTIFTAFVLGYALTQPIAGRLADRFGAYRVIAIGIVWWSVITVITGMISTTFAGAFGLMVGIRLLLGIGESVIYPASNRLVANWVPPAERGFANGLIFAGVGFGAGVAPPLVTFIMVAHGWRAAFYASAAIGMIALVIWLLLARERPEQHPMIGEEELSYIETARLAGSDVGTPDAKILSWGAIFASRSVRLLALSYFCFGYVAYIFFTWFFTYLSTVRGLDLKSSGIYGMLPFIAMAIASSVGGYASDKLTARFGKRIGRCMPAAVGMALAGVFVAIATQVQDARLAAVVLALGSGSLYLSQSAFWTLSADLGRSSAGSVSGVMNMGNQIGGATVAQVTPIIAASFGWTGSFMAASIAGFVGAIGWLLIDPHGTIDNDRVESDRV